MICMADTLLVDNLLTNNNTVRLQAYSEHNTISK